MAYFVSNISALLDCHKFYIFMVVILPYNSSNKEKVLALYIKKGKLKRLAHFLMKRAFLAQTRSCSVTCRYSSKLKALQAMR